MGRLRWHGDNGSSKKGSSQESCVTDAQDQQKPATIQINSNEMGFRLKREPVHSLLLFFAALHTDSSVRISQMVLHTKAG